MPVLPGHARGEALDARPRPPAVRDDCTTRSSPRLARGAVKEALDLCLACKGCKSDCPVNVDMATYKAEFLSHYYAARLRPRSAYAMGLIYWWARLASQLPRAANFVSHAPGVSWLFKWLGGGRSERATCRASPSSTFRALVRGGARSARPGAPRCMLWPDTFNNYFMPSTVHRRRRGARGAGFEVRFPRRRCAAGGRSTTGACVDRAKTAAATDARGSRATTSRPACRSSGSSRAASPVFRDELVRLAAAKTRTRCALEPQTFTLGEFLDRPRLAPAASARAQAAGCTAIAITSRCSTSARRHALLRKLAADVEVLDSRLLRHGRRVRIRGRTLRRAQSGGERPAVARGARAAAQTTVVADGFCCREQIRQGTGRTPVHLAEVLAAALPPGSRGRGDWARSRR